MAAVMINKVDGAQYGGALTLYHGLNMSPKGYHRPLLGSGGIVPLVPATLHLVLGI